MAPNAEIVAKQDAIATTDGLSKTLTILQAHPDLNMVLGIEESASEGAYQAFLNRGHKKNDANVFVGGINGTQKALTLVRDGTMYRATAAFDQQLLGEAFVTLPEKLIGGEEGDLMTPVKLVEQGDPAIDDLLAAYGG